MQTAKDEELPFHLQGNFAPVTDEITGDDLTVEGAIPPELNGVYMRIGPNPATGESPHWFTGDGMLHGVRLEGGKASWYRNRWVQTRALEDPDLQMISEGGEVDHSIAVANTGIIRHAGKFMALVETSFPTEVTPGLDTVGTYDFDGKLTTAMTAHPKICPVTGEMHFFGYGFFPPYLVYHRVDAEGRLVQSQEIDVTGPTMIHDFAITENNVIFMDLPVVFDLEAAMASLGGGQPQPGAGLPYHWSDDYPARLGVMPRGVPGAAVRWYDIDPCYIFHPFNARDAEDGSIVLDVCRYPELWRGGSDNFNSAVPHRFVIDPAGGRVSESQIVDEPAEFPCVDDRLVGSRVRYGYAVSSPDLLVGPGELSKILKIDFDTGNNTAYDLPTGQVPGEVTFAPVGEGEDEGYLMFFAYDKSRDGSDLVILDATQPQAGPVARVAMPQRVPFGFHGNWFADQ